MIYLASALRVVVVPFPSSKHWSRPLEVALHSRLVVLSHQFHLPTIEWCGCRDGWTDGRTIGEAAEWKNGKYDAIRGKSAACFAEMDARNALSTASSSSSTFLLSSSSSCFYCAYSCILTSTCCVLDLPRFYRQYITASVQPDAPRSCCRCEDKHRC